MGRLKALRSSVKRLAPRLTTRIDAHGHSQTADWRAWYGTRRWKRLRWDTLVRDNFRCQCGCGVVEPDTSKLVADHKKPHRGDPALFWDPANLQTLRKSPCHDQVKQAEERAARARGGI